MNGLAYVQPQSYLVQISFPIHRIKKDFKLAKWLGKKTFEDWEERGSKVESWRECYALIQSQQNKGWIKAPWNSRTLFPISLKNGRHAQISVKLNKCSHPIHQFLCISGIRTLEVNSSHGRHEMWLTPGFKQDNKQHDQNSSSPSFFSSRLLILSDILNYCTVDLIFLL
jgi:hypothetical protein